MPSTTMPLTRRQFSYTLCGLPFAFPFKLAAQDTNIEGPWDGPATVAKVYLATRPSWPKPDLDIPQEVAEVDARLAEVQRKNARNVRFVGGEVIKTAEEFKPLAAKMGPIDGVLFIPIAHGAAIGPLLDAINVPALFFSRPYATHAWSGIADVRKSGRKIDVVASASYGDLDPYMEAFRAAHHLRNSKVMVGVGNPERGRPAADAFNKQFGVGFRFVSGNDLKQAFDAADERTAQKAADEFTRGALRVIDTTPEEIRKGLRFYQAMLNMMKQEKANAFAIDCFGSLATRTLPGYPCIAWSKLNDAGLYGVCEADLQSAMTMILVTGHSGMPGFISDPVFDTSRNEVTHAHCVSATKMRGLNGPSYPYVVRKHLETNEGAVLQVMMPAGDAVTVARFASPTKMLVSSAEVTGAVMDSDRGCRTQVRTRVSDAEKWLQNYTAGLHRVLFYGDHTKDIERMGRLMGFEVVHEI